MSTEEQTVTTNGDLNDNTDADVKTDNANHGITDGEKENKGIDKIEEENEEQRSPTPEYTPPGSMISLQNEEQKETDKQEIVNGEEDRESEITDKKTTDPIILPTADMSQTDAQAEPGTKTPEESTESANQKSEEKTEETSQSNETKQTNEEPVKSEASADDKDAEKKEPEKTTDDQKDAVDKQDGTAKEAVVIATGGAMATEEMEKKIKENEELQKKLESALSNQEGQREAYQKLVDENVKLRKHHDDMKEKYEEMEGGHVLLAAELETLKKVNAEQKDTIGKQEKEIQVLKETQGGDETVKDLQEKLIRLSNEQEEKDKRIHSLEGELDATKEKLKDAESNASRGQNGTQGDGAKSKTCIVM